MVEQIIKPTVEQIIKPTMQGDFQIYQKDSNTAVIKNRKMPERGEVVVSKGQAYSEVISKVKERFGLDIQEIDKKLYDSNGDGKAAIDELTGLDSALEIQSRSVKAAQVPSDLTSQMNIAVNLKVWDLSTGIPFDTGKVLPKGEIFFTGNRIDIDKKIYDEYAWMNPETKQMEKGYLKLQELNKERANKNVIGMDTWKKGGIGGAVGAVAGAGVGAGLVATGLITAGFIPGIGWGILAGVAVGIGVGMLWGWLSNRKNQ